MKADEGVVMAEDEWVNRDVHFFSVLEQRFRKLLGLNDRRSIGGAAIDVG